MKGLDKQIEEILIKSALYDGAVTADYEYDLLPSESSELDAKDLAKAIAQAVQEALAKQREELTKIIWEEVEPCEPDCDDVRHATHQGQWDMAVRLENRVEVESLGKDKE
jgi:hypothetical protein